MSKLRVATVRHVETVYRESHAIWGGGLAYEDYLGIWRELEATRWGRRHMTFLVWTDDRDRVLSSLKLYRPRIRVGREVARAAVLGAVFTPSQMRRRGHASDLIRAVLAQARERGDRPALLFSDVDPRFYAALGFRSLPADQIWCRLPRSLPEAADSLDLRPSRHEDREQMLRAQRETARARSIAILRDEDHLEFLRVRTESFFRRLADPSVRPQSLVAWDRREFLGYLWTVEGRGEWSVRDIASRDGDPAVMARIVRAAAADAVRRGLRTMHAWLPREVCAGLGSWKLRREPRERALPMVAPLGAALPNPNQGAPDRFFIPFPDQF